MKFDSRSDAKRQMTAEQIGHHRRAALIGHAGQLDAGLLLHQLESDMAMEPMPGLSDGELAGLGLCDIDHGLEARHRRIHARDDATGDFTTTTTGTRSRAGS